MEVLKIRNSSGEWQEVAAIKGSDGYTPVKGVDYFTDEDKQELVELVLAALPNGDEVSY